MRLQFGQPNQLTSWEFLSSACTPFGAPERKHFEHHLEALKDFGYRLFVLMQIDATDGQLICYFCEGGGAWNNKQPHQQSNAANIPAV